MNSGYMKDLLKDWKERAEKAEAELGRVQAAAARMREVLMDIIEEFDDRYDGAPDARMQWMASLMHDINHALSSTACIGYVRADDMVQALEGALVICQAFSDGQEASPGFMDNNENVLRIKDALAKAKRFLA